MRMSTELLNKFSYSSPPPNMRRLLLSKIATRFVPKTVSRSHTNPSTSTVTSIVGRRRWTRMLAGLFVESPKCWPTTQRRPTRGAVHTVCVRVCQLHSDIWTSSTQTHTHGKEFNVTDSPRTILILVVVVKVKLTASSGFDTHIQGKSCLVRGSWTEGML